MKTPSEIFDQMQQEASNREYNLDGEWFWHYPSTMRAVICRAVDLAREGLI